MKLKFNPKLILGLILIGTSITACKTPQTLQKTTISDDSLMTLVQKQTFNYFWEGAEPNSGMARERIHLDGQYPLNYFNVVTVGGSGFGIMATIVAAERGFISADEATKRFDRIVDFLAKADRYHGAWSHWIDGPTGKSKVFGNQDDAADIVETAFMAQALICLREYYQNGNDQQQQVAKKADALWKGIDWDFFRNGQDVLYWHWSPTHGWGMNHAIQGYDECLISYVLAASSPTHPIPASTYHKGWARSGAIVSTGEKYGIPLILKHNAPEHAVGPLFWSHYSYLGLNPKGLQDQYADYWKVNVNHTKINIEYAKQNPHQFKGYGENSWGLTASYSVKGYDAHHPDNDKGVISPTAALSSIPYAPEESLKAMHYFYEQKGTELFGKYGFYDAFSETENWYPQRYLAIDQGPIVVMIENYRTGLIWNLFMQAPEIKAGLKNLGFKSPKL